MPFLLVLFEAKEISSRSLGEERVRCQKLISYRIHIKNERHQDRLLMKICFDEQSYLGFNHVRLSDIFHCNQFWWLVKYSSLIPKSQRKVLWCLNFIFLEFRGVSSLFPWLSELINEKLNQRFSYHNILLSQIFSVILSVMVTLPHYIIWYLKCTLRASVPLQCTLSIQLYFLQLSDSNPLNSTQCSIASLSSVPFPILPFHGEHL